jgi:hypothetical protein
VSKNVTPRSTAARSSAIDAAFSGNGLYECVIPMQPSPIAETSSPLVPNVRFFIDSLLVIACLIGRRANVFFVRHAFRS